MNAVLLLLFAGFAGIKLQAPEVWTVGAPELPKVIAVTDAPRVSWYVYRLGDMDRKAVPTHAVDPKTLFLTTATLGRYVFVGFAGDAQDSVVVEVKAAADSPSLPPVVSPKPPIAPPTDAAREAQLAKLAAAIAGQKTRTADQIKRDAGRLAAFYLWLAHLADTQKFASLNDLTNRINAEQNRIFIGTDLASIASAYPAWSAEIQPLFIAVVQDESKDWQAFPDEKRKRFVAFMQLLVDALSRVAR